MFGQTAHPAAAIAVSPWGLMFAREPEPDPDLDTLPTEDVDQSGHEPPSPPPSRPASRAPWSILVLLVLVGVGAYLFMNLDQVTGLLPESVLDLLGETPPRPAPPAPGDASETAGSFPPKPTDAMAPPGPPGTPSPPSVEGIMVAAVPTPRFAEGQRVMVSADPAAPAAPLALRGDAAGMIPGPPLGEGSIVTVLDGELHANAWVYSVRTRDGAQGWIPEAHLREKP
jgi:hypothetical protein